MTKRKNILSGRRAASFLIALGFLFAAAANAPAQLLKSVCPDLKKEPCVTAKNMIAASQIIVLGEAPQGDDWTYTAERMLQQANVIGEQKFKAGIKLADAVEYWKDYAASPFSGEGGMYLTVRRAFYEVYGTTPSKERNEVYVALMKQKKAWYATIVQTEREIVNTYPNEREKIIKHAVFLTMGRQPSEFEMDKWKKEKSDFRKIFAFNRAWLHSPSGVAALHDVTKRALTAINKKEPSTAEVAAAAAKYKAGKKVYSEMVSGKDLPYGF